LVNQQRDVTELTSVKFVCADVFVLLRFTCTFAADPWCCTVCRLTPERDLFTEVLLPFWRLYFYFRAFTKIHKP